MSDFEIDFNNPLYEGKLTSIYKAIDKAKNKIYAIKRMSLNFFKEEEINIEINNMIIMNECQNSIKYYGYFKDANYFYIIMELCEFSLDKVINEKKGNIKEIKEILEQLNNALKIMYDNGIIHKNIKPENILIKKLENNKYIYKLTDYGLSKVFKEKDNIEALEYIAPEIKNNINSSKSKVDLWSIGILIYKLYFGNTPKNNIIQKTENKYLDDLIQKLLIQNPFDENNYKCRINWQNYFNHCFFENNYKKEILDLNNSLDKFNKTINTMINFINKKFENFKNIINKEKESIFTDEYNKKIKNISNLLNDFYFNDDKNKFSEIFRIFEKSIFNQKVLLEKKVFIDNNIIYQGETIKGTNIKNGEGMEYSLKINDNKYIFRGEYLNGKRNGNGKEYYDNSKLKYNGEYKEGKIWNGKGYNINGNIEFKIKNGNGKIKEYNNDGKLLFEGEYSNGERNGKGKEYNNYNKLKFEGEYLNGKRNGKGKEYDYDGRLEFEGEYLNGEKHGKVKEYFHDGTLRFEGEYLNGEKHGKVKEYFHDGRLEFEGEYLNGKKHGKVKEYEYDENYKLRFEGEYKEGEKWNGKSYIKCKRRKIRTGSSYFYSNEIYLESEYLNGKKNVKVKEYYSNNNLKYEGEYKEGKIWSGKGYNKDGKKEFEMKNGNGKGKEYNQYSGIIIFEGQYLNGIRNGKGKQYYDDFDDLILEYEGEYKNGKRNGKGKEYYHHNDGLRFEGEYLDGKPWKGRKYYDNGKLAFEGILFGNGKTKEYYKNGKLAFEAEFLNGKGKGKEYYENGKLKFEGEYIEERNKREYWNGKLYCEEPEPQIIEIIEGQMYHEGKLLFDPNRLK